MALTESTPTISYDGNGSTVTPYAIPWLFLQDSHLKMYIDGALSSDGFVASGAGNDAGGSVTTTVAYTSSQKVTFIRETPYDQPTDLEDGGRVPAETLEDAYDYVVMQIQQLKEMLNRAPVAPPGSTWTGDGFVSYIENQSALTTAQRAQGSRNIRALHYAGLVNLNPTDHTPANLETFLKGLAPFTTGEIYMLAIDANDNTPHDPWLINDDNGNTHTFFSTSKIEVVDNSADLNLKKLRISFSSSTGSWHATAGVHVPWPEGEIVVEPFTGP